MNGIKGPFKNLKNIILASGSPRRQYLLSTLGIYFEVQKSDAPELKHGLPPIEMSMLNAKNKVEDVLKRKHKGVIIGADTFVVIGEEVLGKPKNTQDAYEMLKKISGNWHEVITGCCVVDNSGEVIERQEFYVISKVLLDRIDECIIKRYIDTGEPLDKAGSYAIQGIGGFFVKEIIGSYTNIIGLPLNEIVRSLLKFKAITV